MFRSPNADEDLSISELSLQDAPSSSGASTSSRPFSLLAQPNDHKDTSPQPEVVSDGQNSNEENELLVAEETAAKKATLKTREERLQHDLFVLQKLNSAFAIYNDALRDTNLGAEHVGQQLLQTNTLLDKYINVLSKSEATNRLIFDERWHGAAIDEEILEKERLEVEQRILREEAERLLALEKEKEARENEERLQHEREEKARIEAENREKLAVRAGYGGVRGVRGTRASLRARGVGRAATTTSRSTSTRGRPSKVSPISGPASRIARPSSSVSVKSVSRTSYEPSPM